MRKKSIYLTIILTALSVTGSYAQTAHFGLVHILQTF